MTLLLFSVYQWITESIKMQTTTNPLVQAKLKKIDGTAPRGALGVTSMRHLSSTSGALEEYFSSTSLNIFFSQLFFCSARATDRMLEVQSQGERNIGNTLGCATCAILFLLPHFDVICELPRDTSTATQNLLVFADTTTK